MKSMERLYMKKYLKNLNLQNPSKELMEIISQAKTKSSGLNKSSRKKFLPELTTPQLEFFAMEHNNSDGKFKILSQIYFMIRLINEFDKNDLDMDDINFIFNECFGIDYIEPSAPTSQAPMVQPSATTNTDDDVKPTELEPSTPMVSKRSYNTAEVQNWIEESEEIEEDKLKHIKPSTQYLKCTQCNKALNLSSECKNVDCTEYVEDDDNSENW